MRWVSHLPVVRLGADLGPISLHVRSTARGTPYAWEPFLCFCMPGTGVRTGIWDAWEEEPLRWCHTHSGVLFPLLLSRCQSLC